MPTPVLALEGVTKRFGRAVAVDRLSLTIERGEIFTLLGPSGCGKTTSLRLIAGLEQPDEGRIRLHDRIIVDTAAGVFIPPEKRNMGMVFQSYAIWPHRSVFENVAYPLRVRGVRGAALTKRVRQVLELVGLSAFEHRRAPELSGGQQQRVALARALVYEPDVVLLDEPFSNLDANLREQMRMQLKSLLHTIGATVVLVTHDQTEALSLSDRIALMNDSKLVQIGRPLDLYRAPTNAFVRDFFGRTSLLSGNIAGATDAGLLLTLAGLPAATVMLPNKHANGFARGAQVVVSIRPEDVVISRTPNGPGIEGTVQSALFLGERYECCVQIGKEMAVFAYAPLGAGIGEGDRVYLTLASEGVCLWPV